jgi:hypothetical protein
MKLNILKTLLLIIAGCTLIVSCDDAIETKSKYKEDYLNSNKSEAYYKALRQYKKSDHEKSFGWYGNWTGVGASLANCLSALPDSTDFVSLWGCWKNPTKEMQKDLKFVQDVKGTKALICFIILDVGDQITPEEHSNSLADRQAYWGWKDGDSVAIDQSIRKYANAICDTIDKYHYDGFDLDWEPSYAQPFQTMKSIVPYIKIFIDEMSKRIGPESKTGRMFVIDGEPAHSNIPDEYGTKFDYFIEQAYYVSSYTALDSRAKAVIDKYSGVMSVEEIAKKYIACVNFESYASTGGDGRFYGRDGKAYTQLVGMAAWNPSYEGKTYRKGGAGSYHMEYEYTVTGKSGTYPFLREAIQKMNPTVQ